MKDVPRDMAEDDWCEWTINNTYKYLTDNSEILGFLYFRKYCFVRTVMKNLFPILLHEIGHLYTPESPEATAQQEIDAHSWAFNQILLMNRQDWFISYINILKRIAIRNSDEIVTAAQASLNFFTGEYKTLYDYNLIYQKFVQNRQFQIKA